MKKLRWEKCKPFLSNTRSLEEVEVGSENSPISFQLESNRTIQSMVKMTVIKDSNMDTNYNKWIWCEWIEKGVILASIGSKIKCIWTENLNINMNKSKYR